MRAGRALDVLAASRDGYIRSNAGEGPSPVGALHV
jgi:hypothetical protein